MGDRIIEKESSIEIKKKNYLCKKSLKRMINKIKYEEITFYLNAYQHSQ